MQGSVLTLGEKIALAARLAAVEHVRQELDAEAALVAESSWRSATPVGDRSGFKDESDAAAPTRPVSQLLGECFADIAEHHAMPRATPRALPRPSTARPASPALRRRKGAA